MNLVERLIDMRAITSSHRADTNGLSKYAAEGKNLAFIGPRLIQVNNILRTPSLAKGLQAYHEKFLCMGPALNDKQFNNPIQRILIAKKNLAELYEMCLVQLMNHYFGVTEDEYGFIDVLNDVIADNGQYSFKVEFITYVLNTGLAEIRFLKGEANNRCETDEDRKDFAEGYFSMWNAWIEDAKSLNF